MSCDAITAVLFVGLPGFTKMICNVIKAVLFEGELAV